MLPGIILAFVLYSLSQGFNNIIGIELLGYEKSPISTAMIAILIGIFFGNIFKVRNIMTLGLNFTQNYILKLGIICLGIQLKPFEFLEFGKISIPLIIICIISVLIVVKLIIKKLKIPRHMAYLISIGSTVCGTTAIMARPLRCSLGLNFVNLMRDGVPGHLALIQPSHGNDWRSEIREHAETVANYVLQPNPCNDGMTVSKHAFAESVRFAINVKSSTTNDSYITFHRRNLGTERKSRIGDRVLTDPLRRERIRYFYT